MIQPENSKYFKLTIEQLDKVGNAMAFLSKEIPCLSKTKMLKLLYLLDELSIKKSGIPFFNLQYKAWKLGPVAEEIFVELSDKLNWFAKFVEIQNLNNETYILPKSDFCDDEFSDNDIDLLEDVVSKFKDTTVQQLVFYLHRPHSPWRIATESNGVYEMLENGYINNTEIVIDMSCLVNHDERKKAIYEQYMQEK